MKKLLLKIKTEAIWLLKAEPFSGIFILLTFFGIICYPFDSQKMVLGCMTVCFASIFAYVSNYHSRRQLKFELFKRRMQMVEKLSKAYTAMNFHLSITGTKSDAKHTDDWEEIMQFSIPIEIECLFKSTKIHDLCYKFSYWGMIAFKDKDKRSMFEQVSGELFAEIKEETKLY